MRLTRGRTGVGPRSVPAGQFEHGQRLQRAMSQISRRRFLHHTLTAGAGLSLPVPVVFAQAPAIVASESSRPQMPSGIQFGDPLSDRVMVWSRADRTARL